WPERAAHAVSGHMRLRNWRRNPPPPPTITPPSPMASIGTRLGRPQVRGERHCPGWDRSSTLRASAMSREGLKFHPEFERIAAAVVRLRGQGAGRPVRTIVYRAAVPRYAEIPHLISG